MIKSIVTPKVVPPDERTYPYLGYIPADVPPAGSDTGFVVLFTSAGTGVCVAKEAAARASVGDFCTSWVEELFTPFGGRVTLENAS